MATYTHLSRSDIEAVISNYPLRLVEVRPLPGGAANSSYLLHTDAGPHVLTVLDNHDRDSASKLVQLMRHLVCHRIPTSHPVRTLDGDDLAEFAGRAVVIKQYLHGRCQPHLHPGDHHQAGQLLAKVNAVPPPPWLPRNSRRLPADWATVTDKFHDRTFRTWMHTQHDIAAAVNTLNGPYGLVHGDYFADNLVVGDDGTIAVLDWETATTDLLLLDVGMAIVGLCRHDGTFLPEQATQLLSGYQSHRRLQEAERGLLFEAALYASLVIAYHRYRRHHLTHPDPAKADLYKEIPRFVDNLRAQWSNVGPGSASSPR